jgi:hypothetical protein
MECEPPPALCEIRPLIVRSESEPSHGRDVRFDLARPNPTVTVEEAQCRKQERQAYVAQGQDLGREFFWDYTKGLEAVGLSEQA